MQHTKDRLAEAFVAGWSSKDGHDPAIFDDDVVFEVPVFPEPVRFEGKEQMRRFRGAIEEFMPDYAQTLERVHATSDPDTLIFETSGAGHVSGGGSYEQRYVYLVDVRGDRIARVREYGNPYRLFEVADPDQIAAVISEIVGERV
jgi:ketosteroid isomerase-like protein